MSINPSFLVCHKGDVVYVPAVLQLFCASEIERITQHYWFETSSVFLEANAVRHGDVVQCIKIGEFLLQGSLTPAVKALLKSWTVIIFDDRELIVWVALEVERELGLAANRIVQLFGLPIGNHGPTRSVLIFLVLDCIAQVLLPY